MIKNLVRYFNPFIFKEKPVLPLADLAFLLMDRRKFAFIRDSNKKAVGPATAGLAFLCMSPN
jgi:hypothetical protein